MTIANSAEHVHESEAELVTMAAEALTSCNWTIGEAASKWTERWAAGRTDADFAELIGSSRQTVNFARRIYDRFCSRGSKRTLGVAWRQWKELLTWDDAEECLDWMDETGATWRELVAWRNIKHGQPPEPEPPTITTRAPEPDPPLLVPAATPNTANTAPKAAPQPPTEPPDVLKAVRDSVKALRAAVEHVPDSDKAKVAKRLRAVADELDPPKSSPRFKPPTVAEVAEYCRERGNTVDPEGFWDYYETQGWRKANGLKLTDWRGAVRYWESTRKDKQNDSRPKSRAETRERANADAFAAVFRTGKVASNPLLDEGKGGIHAAPGEDVGRGADVVPF